MRGNRIRGTVMNHPGNERKRLRGMLLPGVHDQEGVARGQREGHVLRAAEMAEGACRIGTKMPREAREEEKARFVIPVEGETVEYGDLKAVDGLGLGLGSGYALGVVGASGSGKSTLINALMGLLRAPARVADGRILLSGEDLLDAGEARMRELRCNEVALVPQAAMNALNPIFPIVSQVAEAIRIHSDVKRGAARERAFELLESVGMSRGQAVGYPHEFSGGMRQRTIIAMALANEPRLLVVDEPDHGASIR